VLLAWTLSNGLLAAIIAGLSEKSNDGVKSAQNAVNGYMGFILFSVAGLACAYPFFFSSSFVNGC
jgi:chitin synthase